MVLINFNFDAALAREDQHLVEMPIWYLKHRILKFCTELWLAGRLITETATSMTVKIIKLTKWPLITMLASKHL